MGQRHIQVASWVRGSLQRLKRQNRGVGGGGRRGGEGEGRGRGGGRGERREGRGRERRGERREEEGRWKGERKVMKTKKETFQPDVKCHTCIPLLIMAPRYDLTSSRSTVAVITSTSSRENWEPWEGMRG